MDCASQCRSEPSCGGSSAPSPAPAATWAFLLQEATGDSECDDDLQAAAAFDADDSDAKSCSGGEDCSVDLDERRLVSWECWMMESASVVVVSGEVACLTSTEEEDTAAAGDAETGRLFWEACIAHGY